MKNCPHPICLCLLLLLSGLHALSARADAYVKREVRPMCDALYVR